METLWDCGYSAKKWVPVKTRVQQSPISEVKKNPKQQPRVTSLKLDNICIHESTVGKTVNKQAVHGWTPQRKLLLTEKNIAVRLKFAKDHIDTPQRYWQNVFGTDETKRLNYLGKKKHSIWRTKVTAYHHEILIPTVKCGGGNIMLRSESVRRR